MKSTRPRCRKVVAGLLIFGSLVPHIARAELLPGEHNVEVDMQYISVQALDAPLDNVLDEIAAKAGFRVIRFTAPAGVVTIDVERVTLASALAQLLAGQSYQFLQSSPGSRGADQAPTDMLWLIADGEPVEQAAVEFLESVLLDGSLQEKKRVISQLRQIGSTASIRALSLALADPQDAVRREAFAALQEIGNDEALAAIASATVDDDAWIRGEAATAMAGASTETAIKYLQGILADGDANVRMAAIESLSELPDEQAIELISRALDDPNPAVREYAADALEEVGDELAFQAMIATMEE